MEELHLHIRDMITKDVGPEGPLESITAREINTEFNKSGLSSIRALFALLVMGVGLYAGSGGNWECFSALLHVARADLAQG